jgi:N-acetylglucosaminyldiphosphoundecaprenol N-acetyl-beta-D-mannosaminyltransferase
MMLAPDRSIAETPLPRLRFAGLPFHPLTVDETVQVLAARPASRPFAVYVTPNVEFIYHHRRHPEMQAVFQDCLVSTNDSRILHRLARLAGLELEFAPGAYVVRALFQRAVEADDPLLVVGATPEVAEALRAQFGLTRLVQHIPPMGFIHDPASVRAAVDFVVSHPSRFVFVAMGPPQSETFCQAVRADGRARGVGLCVGSSLQVLTGAIDPAPDWMEHSGLVWLHRLAREPGRLWRRYLVHDLYGIGVCAAEILHHRLVPRREHA